MDDLIRVYVGADRSQLLAVAVLEHSIRRHTSRQVQVCPLIDLDLPEPRDIRQGSRTNFSFARFAIPELAGRAGKALYLDADILTPEAQAVVQTAADYAKSGTPTSIVVVGHTDTSGSDAYNMRLSERRAKAVADALAGLGVAQSALQVDWKGEKDLAVPTPDGVKEPLNRRATINVNF